MATIFARPAHTGKVKKKKPLFASRGFFENNTHLKGKRCEVSLSSDPTILSAPLMKAFRSERTYWPASKEVGQAGLALIGQKNLEPKAIVIDLRSFEKIFSDPEDLVEHLERAAEKLVSRWNGKYGAARLAGKRLPLKDDFVISTLVFNARGGLQRSELILNLNTYTTTINQNDSLTAKIGLRDVVVGIKIRTTLPRPGQDAPESLMGGIDAEDEKRETDCPEGDFEVTFPGFYLSVPNFCRFARSAEVSKACSDLKDYFESNPELLDPAHHVKFKFIEAEDDEEGSTGNASRESGEGTGDDDDNGKGGGSGGVGVDDNSDNDDCSPPSMLNATQELPLSPVSSSSSTIAAAFTQPKHTVKDYMKKRRQQSSVGGPSNKRVK